ncbi:MAG: SPFH domain-containing protein, partial [Candidatus Planktophila sp.]|nr:SPFH domain-containing protein [Candidatus Planktophila sp.]
MVSYGVLALLIIIFGVVLSRAIRIIPQASAGIVERLGRYHRTLPAGLVIIIPFIDRLRPLLDLRERVVSFPPQPVITEDNLVVSIDTVIYFQVTDPKSAIYEIENFIQGIEQLTVTTLRNVVGGLDLEAALTSRDSINAALRGVLDDATGKWGVRVNRVEIKAIDPPPSVQESMEKQMRAERDKRAEQRFCVQKVMLKLRCFVQMEKQLPSSWSLMRCMQQIQMRRCWRISTCNNFLQLPMELQAKLLRFLQERVV